MESNTIAKPLNHEFDTPQHLSLTKDASSIIFSPKLPDHLRSKDPDKVVETINLNTFQTILPHEVTIDDHNVIGAETFQKCNFFFILLHLIDFLVLFI